MQSNVLSRADLQALADDPSIDVRAEIVAKVAHHFQGGEASAEAEAIAGDILAAMSMDKAIRVRQSLAESIKGSRRVPHAIALRLAEDMESVAVPILRASPVFADDDLIVFLGSGSPPKQVAIAGREAVSARLCDAIADVAHVEAVSTLLENAGADIQEPAFGKILDHHGALDSIQLPMAQRTMLPIAVAGRLAGLAPEELRTQIYRRHKLPDEIRDEIAAEAKERALAGQVPAHQRLKQLKDLAASGDLTPALVLRAACAGDAGFLQDALAALSGLDGRVIATLIGDRGYLGMRSALLCARIPMRFVPAFKTALDALREAGGSIAEEGRAAHMKRVLERILTRADRLPAEDMDEFVRLLAPSARKGKRRDVADARRAAH